MADLSKLTLPDDSVRNLKDAAARDSIATLNTKVGSATLTTTASDLSGAINEHETDITGITTDLGSETLPDATKSVKGNINAINSSLAQKLVYKFSYSYTAQSVGANANKSFSADNSIPSGYTAIAIEYMNTGDYMFHARHVNIGTGAFSIHNNSNSAITTSPTLTVTCVKNDMYGGSINPS